MKLRFAIAESLEDTYTSLTEMLRETELDWVMTMEGEQEVFSTKFRTVEVFIREDGVVLNVYADDGTHESREHKLLKTKSELHSALSKRFKKDSDFRFFSGVVTCLNEMREETDDPNNNEAGGTVVS